MLKTFRRNVAQKGDALALLQSLPDGCTPLGFFDPQHRENLDKLAYGNEGARQRERFKLPAMSSGFIDACCREFARIKGRNLTVYPDDALRLAVSRAVAVETSRGWRISKEKQSHKIDVVVALAMACYGAIQKQTSYNLYLPGLYE